MAEITVELRMPGKSDPGYLLLQKRAAAWRKRVESLSQNDESFWDEFADFAAQYIVTPSDLAQKHEAALMLSREQVDQILDCLSGKAYESAEPPLVKPPSSPPG